MLLIRFIAVAQQLKILFITFFTVSTFQLHEKTFSMKSQLLADASLIGMKSKLFRLFYANPIYSVNNNKLILDPSISIFLKPKDLADQFHR